MGSGRSCGTVSGLPGPGHLGAIEQGTQAARGSQGAREPGSQAQPGSPGARQPANKRSRESGTDNADSSERFDNLESLGPIGILRSFKSLNL